MLEATQALTVLAEIAPGPVPRALLDDRLAQIAADLDHNSVFRPGDLPDTHFMRFVIIDDPRGELPALLAWESNHDGATADYLAAVAQATPAINPAKTPSMVTCFQKMPSITPGKNCVTPAYPKSNRETRVVELNMARARLIRLSTTTVIRASLAT